MALLNKNITFKFIRDRKIIFNTPKNTSLINKITSLYGEDFSSSLMKIENNSKEEYEIKGYISDLNYFRGNRNHQMVFVNDRYIKSSKIAEIVEENYKTVIPSGKFPGFILYIYTDPKNIDVNIHPQKYEIKFKDFDSLKKSLSNLLENNLNKNLFSKRYNVKDTKEEFLDSKSNTDFNINFINNKPKPTGVRDDESFYPKNTNGIEKIDVNLNIEEPDNQDVSKETSFYKQDKVENLDFFEDRREYKTKKNKINFNTLHYIGYIFDTYILFQDYKNRVLYIMDQHAAHERINYENYLEKYRNRKITKQEILIPIKINLSADEYETTVKNNNIFKEFGMEVEGFGVNTIIVRTIPSFLQHTDAKKLFYSILENLDRFDRGNIEIDNLIKQACTDSVKSGDILSKKEIDALIEDLLRCDKPYTCPHGRPILVELDEKDLKKLFNRIQS